MLMKIIIVVDDFQRYLMRAQKIIHTDQSIYWISNCVQKIVQRAPNP